MMDPGQDLLLAALSESGISPNDLFDIGPLDVGLGAPLPSAGNQQVGKSHFSIHLDIWLLNTMPFLH